MIEDRQPSDEAAAVPFPPFAYSSRLFERRLCKHSASALISISKQERRRFAFLLFHLTDACFPPSKSTTSSSPEPSPRQRGPPFAFFPRPALPHPAVVALVCIFLHPPLVCRPETQPPLHPPGPAAPSRAVCCLSCFLFAVRLRAELAWLWTPARLQVSASTDQH